MDNCCLPNVALYGRVEGNKARGRPKKCWLDSVTEDCNRHGWGNHTLGRRKWKTSIWLSQRAPASPWQQKKKKKINRSHNAAAFYSLSGKYISNDKSKKLNTNTYVKINLHFLRCYFFHIGSPDPVTLNPKINLYEITLQHKIFLRSFKFQPKVRSVVYYHSVSQLP